MQNSSTIHIGLDVHMESIVVVVAPQRMQAVREGENHVPVRTDDRYSAMVLGSTTYYSEYRIPGRQSF